MTGRAAAVVLIVMLVGLGLPTLGFAQNPTPEPINGWTSQVTRVLLLRDYNTRVVVFGVGVLGGAAGLVGGFTLLRKRALMGDALSHASLPGIAVAFIVAGLIGLNEKSLLILLIGATISGLLGVASILLIRNLTRLKEDAALGIVLSVFFGAGAALLGVIQQMSRGHAAGLEKFIYGKTAEIGAADAQLIAASSLVVIIASALLFKELKLLCFDEGFAGAKGYPVIVLDAALMAMVVLVTIVGLQAVGLVLMIALMVIPAAAARFWTDAMLPMMLGSAVIGAAGSVLGGIMSALFAGLPSGAMIVLVCSGFFFFSMMLGRRSGVIVRGLRRYRLNRRVDRQHLLRAMFERVESAALAGGDASVAKQPLERAAAIRKHRKFAVTIEELLSMRSWSRRRLDRTLDRASEDDLVRVQNGTWRLTQAGFAEAARLTRQHRMWELYLIAYAEVATANVDRDADDIEHVLAPEVIDQLEDLLDEQGMTIVVPASPHVTEVARI